MIVLYVVHNVKDRFFRFRRRRTRPKSVYNGDLVLRATNRSAGMVAFLLGSAALFLGPGAARAAKDSGSSSAALRVLPVGRYDFTAPERDDAALVSEELSGLLRLGGDRYLSIGDEHPCLHRLTIDVDPASGRIRSAAIGAAIRLRDGRGRPISNDSLGSDREGLALGPDDRSVWIANERSGRDPGRSSISLHRLSDGRLVRTFRVGDGSPLPAFERQRANLGFESLTRSAGGGVYWTANEGPLAGDGRRPTESRGGTVRLLRLDRNMRPTAQFAYPLDPYEKPITSPPFLVRREVTGLSDLVALPGGRLLALERTFAGDSSGIASLRIRIYVVDLDGATDVSADPLASGLEGKDFTPARKRLLWEQNFGLTNSNFEGMAFGPKLRDGDRSLILIADNNGGTSQALYALRLRGAGRIPDPW